MNCCCFVLVGDTANGCPSPAEVVYLMGCVHEHIDETPLCSTHRTIADQGNVTCSRCMAAGADTKHHVIQQKN